VLNQFVDDSRIRLAKWASHHLPVRSRVAHDSYALFTQGTGRPYFTGRGITAAPQYGTLKDLRRYGYRYVIVCYNNYERYFAPAVVAAPGHEEEFAYRKAWYDQLFREGKLIWQAKPDHPTYSFTNPEIRVYDIRQ
jgi:hypothetical protein